MYSRNSRLFFKSWINSGIFSIGNLRFVDGILDENYIYHTVQDHRNILSEISVIKKVLKPYKHLIGNHEPSYVNHYPVFNNSSVCIYTFKTCKSKLFYKNLISHKLLEPVQQELYWKDILEIRDVDYTQIYKDNIMHVRDKKIAEFNFKVLHCILPCNCNLVKWKKRESKQCSVCEIDETIEHMLFKCKCNQQIWTNIGKILGFTVELKHVIVGVKGNNIVSFILSLIAFLIYKDWLLNSLSNKGRKENLSLCMFKQDLNYRSLVYRQLGWTDISKVIDTILIRI